jgi:hypothetical protein
MPLALHPCFSKARGGALLGTPAMETETSPGGPQPALHQSQEAELRLTALYGVLFLLSGVALVAITYVLFERATEYESPHLPRIPRTHSPSIHDLRLPPQGAPIRPLPHPHHLNQAAQGWHWSSMSGNRPGLRPRPLATSSPRSLDLGST